MGKGLIISVLLHSMLVSLFAISGIVLKREPINLSRPVPVNIKTIDEFNRLKAGSKKAKADELSADKANKSQAEKKKTKKKPTPKAAREATVKKKEVKKKPVPEKVKPKKIEKKKPRKKPKKKKAAEKKKNKNARIAKKNFKPDDIKALLNKLPSEREKEKKKKTKKQARKKEKDTLGDERGDDVVMTANEIGYIRSRMAQCWKVQAGGLGSENFVIKLHVNLRRDGTLSSRPKVTNPSSSPFFRVAMESAIRAAIECQPYRLPVSRYKGWKEFIMVLDPKSMHSG